MNAAELVKQSRLKAGLTQAELATRLGTTQSAVARLERAGSNPRLHTIERALRATGHSLSIDSTRPSSSVDVTLISRQLGLSPEERLRAFEASYRDVRKLAGGLV